MLPIRTEMEQFILDAVTTESNNFADIHRRLNNIEILRLLHASMGLQTEAAEFTDNLKAHIFYGKHYDKVNIKEEFGDVLWYLAIAFNELGWEFEEVANLVIAKLRVRYPQKFSAHFAQNRDIAAERAVLEDYKEELTSSYALHVPEGTDINKVTEAIKSHGNIIGRMKDVVLTPDLTAAPLRFKGIVYSEGTEFDIDFTVTGETAYQMRYAMDNYAEVVGIPSDEQEQPSVPGLRITEAPGDTTELWEPLPPQ